MLESVQVDYPHPYPPRVSEFSQTFWDALAEGRFLTTRSVSTSRLTFPPKPLSPDDWSTDMEWVELSGEGTLYSHTTIHASPTAFIAELPYTLCIVDLDEGLRLATRYIGDTPPQIGGRVRLVTVHHTDRVSYAARAH